MIAVIIIIVILSACSKRRPKPARLPKQAPVIVYDPPKLTAAEIQRRAREQEKAEKAERERVLASADMERLEAQKNTLVKLLEAIEAELDGTTDQKRITTLLSKQVSVESKLYNLDRRIDRAYMLARS